MRASTVWCVSGRARARKRAKMQMTTFHDDVSPAAILTGHHRMAEEEQGVMRIGVVVVVV